MTDLFALRASCLTAGKIAGRRFSTAQLVWRPRSKPNNSSVAVRPMAMSLNGNVIKLRVFRLLLSGFPSATPPSLPLTEGRSRTP